MKMRIRTEKEVDVKTLHVNAYVRYWEDAKVNGIEDASGTLMPCVHGDCWCPIIDVDAGVIVNWEKGKTADIHYKVCDGGIYTFKDDDGNSIITMEGYVPKMLCPKESGFGDYIIMDVDENGKIDGWDFDPSFIDRI